jgi:hypothetical protein
MKTYNHEPDRYGPTVNRDYDPVLRRWDHPPPRWLWWYKPPDENAADRVLGIIGFLLLAVGMWFFWFWHPWL